MFAKRAKSNIYPLPMSPRFVPENNNVQTKTNKTELLQNFVSRIMTKKNEQHQIDFLKIYPYFGTNINIVQIWLDNYTAICNKITQKIPKTKILFDPSMSLKEKQEKKDIPSIKKLNLQKNNLVRFIQLGYNNSFIDTNRLNLNMVIDALRQNNESPSIIVEIQQNCIKRDLQQKIHEKKLTIGHRSNGSNILPSFKNFDSVELAKELTRTASKLLNKATTHELIMMTFDNVDKKKYCPHLLKFIDLFNIVSGLIPTEILKQPTDKEQIETINKFINTASELKKLNNYHCLMATICGLNNVAIRRLKHLWNDRPEIKQFLSMEELMSMSKGYSSYRQSINSLGNNTPVIPYIGLLISDMKHCLEIDKFNDEGVNSELYNQVLKFVNGFEQQKKNYNLLKNKEISKMFKNYVVWDNEKMYNLSLKLQPVSGSPSSSELSESDKDEKTVPQIKRATRSFTINTGAKPRPVERKMSISAPPTKPEESKSEKLIEQHTEQKPEISPLQLNKIKNSSFTNSQIEKTIGRIRQITTVPYEKWDALDVAYWLEFVGLKEYQQRFVEEDITGFVLPDITEQHFENVLHIKKLGHRLKLLKEIKKLQDIEQMIV